MTKTGCEASYINNITAMGLTMEIRGINGGFRGKTWEMIFKGRAPG